MVETRSSVNLGVAGTEYKLWVQLRLSTKLNVARSGVCVCVCVCVFDICHIPFFENFLERVTKAL